MAKIIRLSSPGASGATGGGTTPSALQLSFAGSSGRVGDAFSAALVAVGGVPSYTFSISIGSLPPGLTLNTATGAITGTPTTAGSYSFTGRVVDSASTAATIACTLVIPNDAANGYIGTVASITAAEVANGVYQDTNGGLHMAVQIAGSITAAAYPVRVRLWLDYADGAGWTLQGDFYATGASTAWTLGQATQQTGVTIPGTIWVPTDPTKTAWKAAAEANSNAPQPSGSAATVNFTVTPALAVPATDITNIQFIPNPTTGDLITYALADAGVYFWIWNELDYTQPATSALIAGGDPYFKSSFCTVQLGYAATGACTITGGVNCQLTSGTASASDVGNRIHVGSTLAIITAYIDSTHVTLDHAVPNGAGQSYDLWRPAPVDAVNGVEGADDLDAAAQGYWGHKFTDGPPPSALGSTTAQFIGQASWKIPPLTRPDGSTNLYRTFRHWVWGVSRLADNEAGGSSTITLQGGWPGGADHYDLIPAQQTAALDLTRTKANTLGRSLGQDGFGRPQLNIASGAALAVDGGNNLYVPIASDFVVSGGVLTQNVVNLAKAVNFSTEFTTSGGFMAINLLAVNKLIAGDALFAGQATFATSGGGKVIINSSGVTIQNKITSPTVSVALSASAMTITGPSGTLTADSTGVTIANGSNSVQVTASAVTISNSTQAVTLSSSGVTVQYSASSYTQVDSAGFRIIVGPSSVRLSTSNNALSCPLQPSADILMGALAGDNIRIVWPTFTTLAVSAGTLAGYMDFYIGSTQYKVPFYNP